MFHSDIVITLLPACGFSGTLKFSEMCFFSFVHADLCRLKFLLSSPLSTEKNGFSEFEKTQVLPRNEGKIRLWSLRPESVPSKSRNRQRSMLSQ